MSYPLKSVAVFCGSGTSADQSYYDDAYTLGKLLAKQQITLIYGGSNLGLMKAIADAVLDNGGNVIGLIPKVYESEAYAAVKDMRVAHTPHERKMMFYDLADGFIALPGGFGMMEELFESIKWENDSIFKKPCATLNSNGFFTPMFAFLENAVKSGFLKRQNLDRMICDDNSVSLLEKMRAYKPIQETKQ